MKNKNQDTNQEQITSNYELKSEAVNDLVEAMQNDAPVYSQEELNKYRTKKGIQIPQGIKILFIKAWFAGAVCFFILWGLGLYLTDTLDQLVVLGVALGMVTDILVNPLLRFMEKYPGQNHKWMFFPKKKVLNFFLNILYCLLVAFCVYNVYTGINAAVNAAAGTTDKIVLGVEPILFGLLCMGFDMLFVGIKRFFCGIVSDARQKVQSESST